MSPAMQHPTPGASGEPVEAGAGLVGAAPFAKWLIIVRPDSGRSWPEVFAFAESLMADDSLERIVVDERIAHAPFDIEHESTIVGLIHLAVAADAEPRAEFVQRVAAFGGSLYAATEQLTVFTDPARAGAASEHDGIWEMGLLHRRADLTHRQFVDYWRTFHPAMVQRHHPGTAQLRQLETGRAHTADAPEFDGIFQAYYPTYLDFRDRQYAGPESPGLVMADLLEFSDQSKTELLVVHRTTFR